jgi:hypothetical protein
MAMLVEIRTFSSERPASRCVGVIAEAPGNGISHWVYSYTTGYGFSNSLTMKRFHVVPSGNAREYSL